MNVLAIIAFHRCSYRLFAHFSHDLSFHSRALEGHILRVTNAYEKKSEDEVDLTLSQHILAFETSDDG
jgi:hypothetical protein